MNNLERIKQIIREERAKPLSSEQVLDLVDHKANLLTYPELQKYKTLDKAMGKYKALILLYLIKPKFGHWTLIFKRDKNTVEMMDSYGNKPDSQFAFIPEEIRDELNERYPKLTELLLKSGYNVEYNDFPLQKADTLTSDCGRWVAMRLIFRHLSIEQFVKLFTGYCSISSDDLVTLISLLI